MLKVKFPLCLINQALYHEDVWGSGTVAPPFLTSALDGGEWSASRRGRFASGETAHGIHWIGGWKGRRADLDTVEQRRISLPCHKLNPGRSARRQSLYWLSYLGSHIHVPYLHLPIYTHVTMYTSLLLISANSHSHMYLDLLGLTPCSVTDEYQRFWGICYLIYPEDGGRNFLRNVGTYLLIYTVSYPRKLFNSRHHENLKYHLANPTFLSSFPSFFVF
jgi:hypothetical protein